MSSRFCLDSTEVLLIMIVLFRSILDCKTAVFLRTRSSGLRTRGLEPMSKLRVRLERDAVNDFREKRTVLQSSSIHLFSLVQSFLIRISQVFTAVLIL